MVERTVCTTGRCEAGVCERGPERLHYCGEMVVMGRRAMPAIQIPQPTFARHSDRGARLAPYPSPSLRITPHVPNARRELSPPICARRNVDCRMLTLLIMCLSLRAVSSLVHCTADFSDRSSMQAL